MDGHLFSVRTSIVVLPMPLLSPPTVPPDPPQPPDPSKRNVVGAAGQVALGVLSSRLLGFFREMVMADILGAGRGADIFYVAFRIPNMVRELFAEGAMSTGFIPVFTQYLTKKSKAEAAGLARAAFTTLVLILTTVVGMGIFFAPQIVHWIAPGFSDDPGQQRLAVTLTRTMFPFLFFISLAALAMGILNSLGRFGPPAFSSSAFNVVSVATLLFGFGADPVFVAAVGVTLGGAAQCGVQLPALWREGFSFSFQRPIWPLHPGVVRMGHLILPTLLGLSVVQVNLFVNTSLASTFPDGSVSFLYYGMRLVHLPLGLFAVALSTALLPTLAMQGAVGEMKSFQDSVSSSLRLLVFTTVPAMAGLIVLRVPIIHLLFEHGAFDAAATAGTADAVLFYAVGLWAFAGVRVILSAFYAMHDTTTPLKIAVLSMLFNVVLCFALIDSLGYRGLALSTSLSAMFQLFLLSQWLWRRIHSFDWKRFASSSLRTILATFLSLFPAFWSARLPIWHASGIWMTKTAILACTILFTVSGYFAIQVLMKSEESTHLLTLIKSKIKNLPS